MSGFGGGNTLDYKRGVEYISLVAVPAALPDGSPPAASTGATNAATFAIDLKSGAVTSWPWAEKHMGLLAGLHYDEKSDRIYGFGASIWPPAINSTSASASTSAWDGSLAAPAWQKAPPARDPPFSKPSPIHTLAYLDASKPLGSAPFTTVGGIPGYFLLEGAVVTVDPVAQRFYTLMQPVTTVPAWAPSADCSAGPFGPCAAGTSCCVDPAVAGAAGACYKVSDCTSIHDGGGINTTLPLQLVGVDLATAKVQVSPELCTLKKQDCPYAINAADGMRGGA
jgi:hypothetical protein